MPSNRQGSHEPLLPKTSSTNRQDHSNGFKYGTLKAHGKVRHCHSAPAFVIAGPKELLSPRTENPIARTLNPTVTNRDVRSTVTKAAIVLILYLGIGMICYCTVESEFDGERTNRFIDALYFCVVTMTTVGYGDLVPDGILAKLFTCMFVFVGFGLVGLLLGSAADFLVEKQESLLVKAFDKIKKQAGHEDFSEFSELHQIKKIHWKVAVAGMLFLVLFVVGVLFLARVEGMDLLDAFYCVCVTVTTLGYGDHSFQTLNGRIFAVIWILASTICLGQFFLYIAELQTEARRLSLVHWVVTRKTTLSDLEAADMDNDGVVSVSEFILYKLKEMGKIEEEDVAEIMKEFEDLDVDNSGTLSKSDLNLADTASEDERPS